MPRESNNRPPIQIGALLRLALDDLRRRIHEGVAVAGFDDVRPAHTTLFRWPGPDGRRPTEIAADVQISKQRVNDLLRDLEQLSYLRLDRDPSDNRARIIRLTRRGKCLHQAAIAAHTELEDEWRQAVGPAAYAQLRHALAQITGT